jgi:hypothetical protein
MGWPCFPLSMCKADHGLKAEHGMSGTWAGLTMAWSRAGLTFGLVGDGLDMDWTYH